MSSAAITSYLTVCFLSSRYNNEKVTGEQRHRRQRPLGGSLTTESEFSEGWSSDGGAGGAPRVHLLSPPFFCLTQINLLCCIPQGAEDMQTQSTCKLTHTHFDANL